ncbi:MAG TPA: type II secretion system F family protein [Acidimicrobiales bacterium]|nr:type II secretion system F family protein [Acidimicrobiales bacterium]HWI02861.1 type II secretion system F family protein [Acidimicrobiales bacterium]
MRILGALAAFVAGAGAGFAALKELEHRAVTRSSSRLLAAYGPDGVAVADVVRRRVHLVDSMVARAARVAVGVVPPFFAERARQRLQVAGYGQPETAERYLAAKVVLLATGVPLGALVVAVLHPTGLMAAAVLALPPVACAVAPDALLQRRIRRRQAAFRAALPDFLDLLTISVEAGLGFEQAVDRIARGTEGVLAEEFRRVLGETVAGSSRAVAMRSMAERVDLPEMRAFVLAVVQADGFGISIGDVLRSQSEEMRVRWRQVAQERAQKAPVKILVPLVFCIFPATFVVILGPAAVKVATGI